MKSIGVKLLTIGLMLCLGVNLNAQKDYAHLNVKVKKNFKMDAPIFVQPFLTDNLLSVELLKEALKSNGFNLVTDEKKADFIVTLSYKDRSDSGCGGRVMKNMDGKVSDNKTGEKNIIFNFSQTMFEGKCTVDVMKALAKKIKDELAK